MALRNQPYLPLYVQDFISDEKLRECSAESIGVYIFIMCVMHKSKEYGKIKLSEKYICLSKNQAPTSTFALMLAKHLPFSTTVIENSLNELLKEGVIQIEENTIIQKRMVKDCKISEARAGAGKLGGEKRVNNELICLSKKSSKSKAKVQANSEYEDEDVIEDTSKNIVYSDIINYLNEKAGTNFKASSLKTRDFINARLNEKFTVDDFKKVIQSKCSEWIGGEYEKFLRPETLFSNKFEGYLNNKNRNSTAQPKVINGRMEL